MDQVYKTISELTKKNDLSNTEELKNLVSNLYNDYTTKRTCIKAMIFDIFYYECLNKIKDKLRIRKIQKTLAFIKKTLKSFITPEKLKIIEADISKEGKNRNLEIIDNVKMTEENYKIKYTLEEDYTAMEGILKGNHENIGKENIILENNNNLQEFINDIGTRVDENNSINLNNKNNNGEEANIIDLLGVNQVVKEIANESYNKEDGTSKNLSENMGQLGYKLELKEDQGNNQLENNNDSIMKNLMYSFKKENIFKADDTLFVENKDQENMTELSNTTSIVFTKKKISSKPLNSSIKIVSRNCEKN